jgi:hypothetical protein
MLPGLVKHNLQRLPAEPATFSTGLTCNGVCVTAEHLHNWRITLIGVTSYLALGALIYIVGWVFARTAPNYVVMQHNPPKSRQACKDAMCEHAEPPKLAEC